MSGLDGEGPRVGSLRRRSLAGMAWLSLASGGQVVLQIGVLAVLARHVSPAEFGVASAALVVVGLTAVFTEAGVGPALVQRPEIDDRHVRTAWTFQVVVALVLWALVVVGAATIAAVFAMPELVRVVPVAGVALVIQSLTLGEFLLQRELAFRRIAAVDFAAWSLGYGGTAVVLALAGAGVWAIVLGNVAQATLRTLLLWWARPHRVRPMLDGGILREVLAFGGGYTLGWWANYVARQADNVVVGRWLGAAALGLYTRAYSLMRQPAVLFGRVVSRVLFPVLASVQHDRPRLRAAYLRSVALVALAVLPFTAVTALTSEEVIAVVLGERWLEVHGAFSVMVFGMLFRTSYKLSDALSTATGHVYRRAARQVLYAAMVVAGAWIGQGWGLVGVATGILLALAGNFLLMARLALDVAGGTWREFAAAHVPGLVMSVVVAVPTAIVLHLLRMVEAPPWALLASAVGIAAATVSVVLRMAPRLTALRFLATTRTELLDVLRAGSRLRRLALLVMGDEPRPRARAVVGSRP